MKSPHPTSPRGVTLVELTVVIAMILGLSSSLFFSASYYRESANQASCILQIEAMQKAIRSHQNFHNLAAGDTILKSDIVGPGKAIPEELFCPHSGGAYIIADEILVPGVAFATCADYDASNGNIDKTQAHNPRATTAW